MLLMSVPQKVHEHQAATNLSCCNLHELLESFAILAIARPQPEWYRKAMPPTPGSAHRAA